MHATVPLCSDGALSVPLLANFLKETAFHVVQPHDLRIIRRILAQRLHENISNKNSAQIIIRAECYFIFQTYS